jgi:hypothetical protein
MISMGGEKMKRFFVPLVIVVLIFLLSGCIWGDKPLPKIVLIDDSHANRFGGEESEFFDGIIAILAAKGYDYRYSSVVGFEPQNYAIVILSMPGASYSISDIDKLETQLTKKGKIIMMDMLVEIPPASTFFLDALSDGLNTGIGFVWGLVTDTVNNIGGNKMMITTDNFTTHPLASTLSAKIAMMMATKLTVEGNATVAIFAESSAIFTTYVPSGDEVTYVPEAAPPIPIVVASNIGGGKVVAISSAYAFTGTLMGIVPGNTDLFRAAVDW